MGTGREREGAAGPSRRRFLELGMAAAAALPLGCITSPEDDDQEGGPSRLRVAPAAPDEPLPAGRHALGLGSSRDGWLFVPAAASAGVGVPLAVLLHGAGQSADEWNGGVPIFESLGMAALSVDARSATWDVLRGGYGPDVRFIEAALAHAFRHVPVDPSRLALAGFSDGASYALSLGLTNGDVVPFVLAFSPGFLSPAASRGTPRFHVTHGTHDRILPIDTTSRRIVPGLREAGYEVVYEEFEGGHELPRALGEKVFGWLARGGAAAPGEG